MNGFISFLFYLNYCSSQTRFVRTLFTTTLYLTSAKQITKAAVHREQHKADYEKDVEKMRQKHCKDLKPVGGKKRKGTPTDRLGAGSTNPKKRVKAVAGENMVKVKQEPTAGSDVRAEVSAIRTGFVDIVCINRQNSFVQKS